MARANLSALLGNVDEPDASRVATPDRKATEPPPARVGKPSPAKTQPEPSPQPALESEPLYLRLVRKEARLRDEQYAALTEHARRLSRARRGRGARITENTLIRIAVDLLLDRIETASGNDEHELREALR